VPMYVYLLEDNTSRRSLGSDRDLELHSCRRKSPRLTQTFWGHEMIKASAMR
ncbi:hypothetical protein HispidOSU_008256, partial [Sigmodon hispidus]